MTPTSPPASKHLGWLLLAMLAFSTFLNYIDRQTLSLLAKPIQLELMMDDAAYAVIVSCFMVAYMLGNLTSGYVIDKLGPMRALPFFVVAWSFAGAFCGLAQSAPQLGVSRFLLGLFETGNFIAAPIIVALYLPDHQRTFGVGVYTAAAMFGAAVSPPMVTQINELVGWRNAFIIMGAAGVVWVMAWQLLPVGNPRELEKTERDSAVSRGAIDLTSWSEAVRQPKVWAYAFGAMLTYPVWFFYLNWFPKYLTDERGLSTLQMGARAWVVYLFAGIGCMVAGAIVAGLVRTRLTPVKARLVVLGGVSILAPIGALNFFEPALTVSLGIAACVALIHMIWQTTLTSLPIELFTSRSLGKVFGVAGMASGLGGVLSTWLIGRLVGVVSYKPMFLVMGVVYAIALAAVIAMLRRPDRVARPIAATKAESAT